MAKRVGRLVLGETWVNHHGKHKHASTRGIIATAWGKTRSCTASRMAGFGSSTDVYEVQVPLPGDSKPLVLGQVTARTRRL